MLLKGDNFHCTAFTALLLLHSWSADM